MSIVCNMTVREGTATVDTVFWAVIGANGKLTGYAGGVDRKRGLLEHERAA
jgi:hypothetical protein